MKFLNKLEPVSKVMLNELIRSSKSFEIRKKAHAILLSSRGYPSEQIAAIFKVDDKVVCEWLSRWEQQGLEGLYEILHTSGYPGKI
jgi:transposase